MRFERTDSFKADCRRLSPRERAFFKEAVRLFGDGRDTVADTRGPGARPYSLLLKSIAGARAVFETTWIFASPDGRATWEWCTVEAEGHRHPSVRWRRMGDHAIFGDP